MKVWILAIAVLVSLGLGSCAPAPEETATMTAPAWTPTPPPPASAPTATAVPYDLTVHVADEGGAPVPGAIIVLAESGSDEPVQVDEAGVYTWYDLPAAEANLQVSAPGYFPVEQPVILERGLTELALILSRDPSAQLPQ